MVSSSLFPQKLSSFKSALFLSSHPELFKEFVCLLTIASAFLLAMEGVYQALLYSRNLRPPLDDRF